MPDLPHVTTHPTPPGSVLTVRMPTDLDPEEVFPLAEELHRQTGLPVVVLSADADLTVATPGEAEDALNAALEDEAAGRARQRTDLAQALLDLLRADGWELIRLRQP